MCILEGALRFGAALTEERRDRWSILREKMTHTVSVATFPCTEQEPADSEGLQRIYKMVPSSARQTPRPVQSGMTVIEAEAFLHFTAGSMRPDGAIWLHEDCGSRQSAEHDLGMILIREDDISRMRRSVVKVKLHISAEGLLLRRPTVNTRGDIRNSSISEAPWDLPITWEGSNPSFSEEMMENVRAQLAEEMKKLHST
jgi:hypothetical protein